MTGSNGTPPTNAWPETGGTSITDLQARARVWTLCLYALVLAALTGPLAGLLTPLAHASVPALTILATALAGAYIAIAVLLIAAVLRVVWPRLDGHR